MRTSKYAINWALSNVKKDEVKKWAIYLHYDKEDGRVYAGKTSDKPIERRFITGASIKGNSGYKGRFKEYLKTHRLEDMVHVVVDTTDDDLEAKRLEEAYTELYQSTDPRYGFNAIVGDKSVPSEKSLKALREASKSNWAEGGACRRANCKYWYTISHPNGEVTIIDSLEEFCREYNINHGNMSYKGYSKGYRVISKEPKNK